MGAQSKRDSKIRKKAKKPHWKAKRDAERLKRQARDKTKATRTRQPNQVIQHFVHLAGEVAKNYEPSGYLKTARIGEPYRGQ